MSAQRNEVLPNGAVCTSRGYVVATLLVFESALIGGFVMAGEGSTVKQAAKNPATVQVPDALPLDGGQRWSLSAGVQWRQIGEVSFKNRESHASNFLSLPQRSLYEEDVAGYYTDGYVLDDSANSGQTWNWGYDNASQLQGNTLSFSGVTTRFDETVKVERMNTDWASDLAGLGGYVGMESPVLYRAKKFQLSASADYGFVQDNTSNKATAFRAVHEINEVSETYTDAYDVSHLGVIPAAPYRGTFNGPGPLLNMNPQRTNGGSSSFNSYETYESTLQQDFDVRLHTVSLGPRVAVSLGRLRANVGLGFAGNVADWEATSRETLIVNDNRTMRTWEDHAEGTSFLPGAYGELGLQWEFMRNWSVNASARYDYAKSLNADLGTSDMTLDLRGVTGRVGIGWSF